MAEETLDKKTFSLTTEKAWGIAAFIVYKVPPLPFKGFKTINLEPLMM
jgi:hypothetical protein